MAGSVLDEISIVLCDLNALSSYDQAGYEKTVSPMAWRLVECRVLVTNGLVVTVLWVHFNLLKPDEVTFTSWLGWVT